MKWGNRIRGLLESISSSVLINSISHLRTTLMFKPILHGDRDRYMIKHNDSSCANLFRAFGKAWLIFLIAVYSATCWGNIVANYILVCTYISHMFIQKIKVDTVDIQSPVSIIGPGANVCFIPTRA